ncbi:FixH family protein [Sphingobacterium bovistauri]|uniref:FixH family protein n=1 Tax=Sphingobacterium bovistauri TaxID=2781959 RepID=A0ABS7ZBA6_9SPHI|nr:FixH family protein [Sphingobacterium bovistauri]MCA5006175.1 FixH family protein [Sphingobacterium bovistauri]
MNWGSKIIVGLASFILFIVGTGIYMVTKDSDTLIDEDYYENSLDYDKVYNSKQNLIDDNAKPNVSVRSDTLFIQFVATVNKGSLIFKRPSDGTLDKQLPLFTSTSEYKLNISSFAKGNWSLEISWNQGGKAYYHNQPLYIQ